LARRGSEHSTLDGLRRGLRELDYTEGADFVIVDRYANSEVNRLAGLVPELVRLNVDLILAPGNQVTRAAMQGTPTIPILSTAPDLLASGFVASLAYPGGNVTGISLTAGAALAQKWLELVKDIVPNVTEVAVLSNSGSAYVERLREAASALGTRMRDFVAGDAGEIDRALLGVAAVRPGALIVESDPMLVSNRAKIIAFAAQNRLPTVYGNRTTCPTVGSSPMRRASMKYGVGSPAMLTECSMVRDQATFPSSNRRDSSSSSTSKPPRRSTSPFRRRSSPAPTR
jgi:putative ABC transport system substrate-binding protein